MSEALIREFQICDELGSGISGTVYSCQSRLTGDSFAVKSINKRLDLANSVKYEPKILRLLSPHPNIIQLHKLYEDETHLHMVIDFCQNKDLFELVINCKGVLKESEGRCLFAQLMKAIHHCHKNGVIHRDIKPENILLDNRFRVKLADFGFAKVVRKGETVNGGAGSPYYRAPEVLLGNEYDEKVDVWSAGVVLYIMLAGFPPFNGRTIEEISKEILRKDLGFPDEVFQSVSTSVIDLLKRMICKDPARRLSAEGVLRHPWFLTV